MKVFIFTFKPNVNRMMLLPTTFTSSISKCYKSHYLCMLCLFYPNNNMKYMLKFNLFIQLLFYKYTILYGIFLKIAASNIVG